MGHDGDGVVAQGSVQGWGHPHLHHLGGVGRDVHGRRVDVHPRIGDALDDQVDGVPPSLVLQDDVEVALGAPGDGVVPGGQVHHGPLEYLRRRVLADVVLQTEECLRRGHGAGFAGQLPATVRLLCGQQVVRADVEPRGRHLGRMEGAGVIEEGVARP